MQQKESSWILTPTILIGINLVAQVLSLLRFALERDNSDGIVSLSIIAGFILFWLGLFSQRHTLVNWLVQRCLWSRIALLIAYSVILIGVWLIVRSELREYLIINWFLAAWFLVLGFPDETGFIAWIAKFKWLIALLLLLFLLPLLITGLTSPGAYPPDESIWFDFGTTSFLLDRIGSRMTLRVDYPVFPGIGWSIAAYGWVLEHTALSVFVGRLWILGFKLLTLVGIGAVATRLYNFKTAVISVIFAYLMRVLITGHEYRPGYQLPAVVIFITFLAIQARYSQSRWRYVWHWGCGFLATQSIQFHATGVVYPVAFSVFYAGEYLWHSYRQRRLIVPDGVLAFGVGALLGVIVHYIFNVQPVGGYNDYMSFLMRENLSQSFRYDRQWQIMLETALIGLSLGFIVWRRNSADRLLLSIWSLVLVTAFFLDHKGYFEIHSAFYALPVGTLLFSSIPKKKGYLGYRSVLVMLMVAVMLLNQSITNIRWQNVQDWIKTGKVEAPNSVFVELGSKLTDEYLTDDDVVVSTSQLLWGMPTTRNLVSLFTTHAARRGYPEFENSLAIWEAVQPTVIVFVSDGEFIAYLDKSSLLEYVQKYNFHECHLFNFHGLEVKLFRQRCAE